MNPRLMSTNDLDSGQSIPPDAVVGIVGAGTMGAGIAEVAASSGYQVKIFDSVPHAVPRALERISGSLAKAVSRGKTTRLAADETERRIAPVTSLFGLGDASLVIEAIVEAVDAKQQLFKDLEEVLSPDCIIATNTSSFSITRLASGLNQPNRFIGMHFFNPAAIMELIEIVPGLVTDDTTVSTIFATAKAWNKTPVRSKSTPGFIVNRVARPFYSEALRLLDERGSDPVTIDCVMREAGRFPMGPFELMDLIGNDVNFAVTQSVFHGFYGDSRFTPSLHQEALVEAGFHGRKTGRGFYRYIEGMEKTSPRLEPSLPPPKEIRLSHGDSLTEGFLSRLGKAYPRAQREKNSNSPDLLATIDDAVLRLTDGRTATQVAFEEHQPNTILDDLAYDYSTATTLSIARAHQCRDTAYRPVVGLLQAAGYNVALFGDLPGLAVMRTVAMLINEAADAYSAQVATYSDIDLAMQKGTRYPTGPFRWSRAIGLGRLSAVLRNLSSYYGEERYRSCPLIQQCLWSGKQLDET